MPYPVLPEDFANKAALLRYIGDVINAQNRFKGLRANPYTEMGEPTPGGGRGFSPRDFSKEGTLLDFPKTNPKVAPEGFENFPGENMGTPQKIQQGIDRLTQFTPQQKYEMALRTQELQRGLEQAKRNPGPMDQIKNEISKILGHDQPSPRSGSGAGGLATHVDLVKMGQDYGLSYDRMVQALNGTQAAGMKSTPENIKYWIAQMRQKGLFHPETGGE